MDSDRPSLQYAGRGNYDSNIASDSDRERPTHLYLHPLTWVIVTVDKVDQAFFTPIQPNSSSLDLICLRIKDRIPIIH